MSWLVANKDSDGTVISWLYRYRVGPRQKERSTREKNKAAALRVQKQWDACRLLHGKFPDELDSQAEKSAGGIIISDAIHRYINQNLAEKNIKPSTAVRYRQHAVKLITFFASIRAELIDDLTPAMLKDYKISRLQQGRAMKTVFEELNLLKSALNQLVDDEEIKESPIKKNNWPAFEKMPAAKPERIGYYTIEEIVKILDYFRAHPDKTIYDFVLAGFCTGARIGELLAIQVKDIDFSENYLALRNFKIESSAENAYRWIPIHQDLLPILVARAKNCLPGAFIFDDVKHHAVNYARKHLVRACKKLGIQYKRFHGARHSFVTLSLRLNIDASSVGETVGHTNYRTTERYNHRRSVSHDNINKLNFMQSKRTAEISSTRF